MVFITRIQAVAMLFTGGDALILHIDMDAFYASVEEREQPDLRGKPLVVGGKPDARGVVAAANYAARKFGIHSAMPSAAAVRLCPHLLILAPRGWLYAEVSAQIRAIFHRYTPIVEPLSLDEAYLDPRGSERLYGDAEQIGRAIKDDIRTELGLVASVGVAPNKFLAKLASDINKPDGFTVLTKAQAQSFLDDLPVERIWGVGKAAKARLNRAGIDTLVQLRRTSASWLQKEFGEYGVRMRQLAHGQDERAVVTEAQVKSISHETTYSTDITAFNALHSSALDLTEGVCYRLRQAGLSGKTVTLKIRFDNFATITRARSLSEASNVTDDIWQLVDALLCRELKNKKFSVRLIGVGVTKFSETSDANATFNANFNNQAHAQTDLFNADGNVKQKDEQAAKQKVKKERQKILDQLSDDLRKRYGKTIIRRGKSIQYSDPFSD